MAKFQAIANAVAALSVAAFFVSLTIILWRTPNLLLHVDGTLTRTEAVLSKINATANNLDKATKTWADSSESQAQAVTGLVRDAHTSISSVNETLASIRTNSENLNQNLASLKNMTDSATGMAQEASMDLRTANGAIQGFQPLITGFQRDSDDLDVLLRNEIPQTLTNVQSMTGNANGILLDGRKVSDKLTEDFLRPVPLWKRPFKYFGDFWDIDAAIARHMP